MKVLIVSPHMDDEVLGVGGVIARHVQQGDHVHVCFIAHRVYGHVFDPQRNDTERGCALDAKRVLGYQDVSFFDLADERLDACVQDIIIPLERLVGQQQPETAYVPHRGDNNQDHRAIFEAMQVVFRPAASGYLRRLLSYEVPSSTDQAPPMQEAAFLPNCYVDISAYIDQKLHALACYETELRQFPHPRSPEGVRVLASYRGMASGYQAAEAFHTLRDRYGAGDQI